MTVARHHSIAATVVVLLLNGRPAVGWAQARATNDGLATQTSASEPILSETNPLQCWWRTSTGAIRVGESVDLTLTCAVLETAALRAVPDESRLTVAAIQLSPFEIVDGGRAPDVRAGDRRVFQYHYRLRIIGPDVIGHDVKLPIVEIPYTIESRAGSGATVAGRDLSHRLPQIALRVVSQVPADADDIRDAGDVSLAAIEGLRFRARTFTMAGWAMAGIALIALLSALVPAAAVLRGTRRTASSRVGERAVLTGAARVLDTRLAEARRTAWTPEALADAHGAMRAVAAIAMGMGTRDVEVGDPAAMPPGRLPVRHGPRRRVAAVTAHATSAHLARALDALPPTASSSTRARFEQLRDGLTAITRLQYGASATVVDRATVEDAVANVRDIARDLARERLWTPRHWFARPAAAPAVPEF